MPEKSGGRPFYLDKDVPAVVISNIDEPFFEFQNRAESAAERDRLIYHAQCQGDRCLLWLGDPKLVFVAFPIAHAEYTRQRLGYQDTCYVTPANPSPALSLDILREPSLIQRLVDYAGAGRRVQLIPYATTPQFLQLAETLRTDYGLDVLLPESPSPEGMWLRDYIDTKAGYRVLVSRWLSNSAELLLPGAVCRDFRQAAAAAHWFASQKQPCIVKADTGHGSLGHCVVHPGDFSCVEAILRHLEHESYLHDDLLVVEKFVHASKSVSPSLELFVPAAGTGGPKITYLCDQLFVGMGNSFLVSRELLDTPWYPTLAESGLFIGAQLQELGYVGHFDLDTIVDDDGHVFLLEVNTRRTAGTHIHEFAQFAFGPDYLEDVVLLGHGAMKSGTITECDELLQVIGDLLYPIQGDRRGVVVSATSTLPLGDFGCIIAASSTAEALALRQALIERIRGVKGETP
jgi:hypothetical protein